LWQKKATRFWWRAAFSAGFDWRLWRESGLRRPGGGQQQLPASLWQIAPQEHQLVLLDRGVDAVGVAGPCYEEVGRCPQRFTQARAAIAKARGHD